MELRLLRLAMWLAVYVACLETMIYLRDLEPKAG
jgi:hypothetical protein